MRRSILPRTLIRQAHTQPPKRNPPKFSGRGKFNPETQEHDYVQEHDYTVTPSTYSYLASDNIEQFERFPLLSNLALYKRKTRPIKSRMLARDFIDDSLYNPHYGYFAKTAEIFSPDSPFRFKEMANIDDFLDSWTEEYKRASADKALNAPEVAKNQDKLLSEKRTAKVNRQVWHTPTELFHPYYGQALARYIVNQFKSQEDQSQLVLYEMGAGNGTLMVDVLDFLRDNEPGIYSKTQYNIIEISASLALKQNVHSAGHRDRVTITNQSVFEWSKREERPCFFIALEVWDNFAHDCIRYDNTTNQPYQAYVVVDGNGDFTQVYSEKLDSLASQFFSLREKINYKPTLQLGVHPLQKPRLLRQLKNSVYSFHGNLSSPEYIPTRYLQFLNVLNEKFPNHKLLASDFTNFDEHISGYCAPVVQTFMEGMPITIPTYMALQGYFDIMFPTDFTLASQLYEQVCKSPAIATPHGTFLKAWASKDTSTRTGEDPMLSFYRNTAFLTS